MLGKVAAISRQRSTLQSKIRSGFVSTFRRQSGQRSASRASAASRTARE